MLSSVVGRSLEALAIVFGSGRHAGTGFSSYAETRSGKDLAHA
ncbi:hypothetical protein ABZ746_25530 [Streptomyces sp. NPDC020096]